MITVKPINTLLKRQQGLVLFIALIALVAMSLAAAALIRSVDSSVLVAGNLAFKQSATMSADSSFGLAAEYINTNGSTINADDAANGYYASLAPPNATGYTADTDVFNFFDESTWGALKSRKATGPGFTNGVDSSGNTVEYIVQRMCRNTGKAPIVEQDCLLGTSKVGGSSNQAQTYTTAGGLQSVGASIMYRVTSRVTGPKNTVSVTQAYIY
jgi:type IV pilus assembly protein PilX